MKLKYELTTVEIDGELMAIPMESEEVFRGVLRMNGITADILKVLENDTTEDKIISALKKEYDATEEQLCFNVQKVVSILREYRLITE